MEKTRSAKVWAGEWPERGTGAAAADLIEGTYQMHVWPKALEKEVQTPAEQ